VGDDVADSESLSVVCTVFDCEHVCAVRRVTPFASLATGYAGFSSTNFFKLQTLGGLPPAVEDAASLSLAEVRCQQRLGGLLKSYARAAA
jgi:hypothetical protein